jgi:hypothetical protein
MNTSPSERRRAKEIYRLFIEDHRFDVDVDDGPKSAYDHETYWWRCYTPDVFRELVFPNMSIPWTSRTVEERFRLVSSFFQSPDTVEEFYQLTGIEPNFPLETFHTLDENPMLHYVAQVLFNQVYRKKLTTSSAQLQGWIYFGTSVLMTSSNPHCLPHGEPVHAKTAFLTNLQYFITGWWQGAEKSLMLLEIWTAMILNAGFDLVSYAKAENAILREIHPLQITWGTSRFRLVQIDLTGLPTLADFKICASTCVEVYQLTQAPGSFPSETHLPSTICWKPSQTEREQGPWVSIRQFELTSGPANADTIPASHREPFVELIEQSQDDAGPLYLMVQRSTRRRRSRSRSRSSPPILRSREWAYTNGQDSSSHPWLPRYSLCPFEMGYRFTQHCCCNHRMAKPIEDLRDCIPKDWSGDGAIFASKRWRDESFLTEIYECGNHEPASSTTLAMKLHTFAADCPRGCDNVQWEKLQVPPPFLAGHPGPHNKPRALWELE